MCVAAIKSALSENQQNHQQRDKSFRKRQKKAPSTVRKAGCPTRTRVKAQQRFACEAFLKSVNPTVNSSAKYYRKIRQLAPAQTT